MSNLKAFLVSQDKTGWSKGEIIKNLEPHDQCEIGTIGVGVCNSESGRGWQAMQLVVCDVEAKPTFIDVCFFEEENEVHDYLDDCKDFGCMKIIASHPQLPNTAPLPEAFIREYVRLQGDCSVEYVNDNHAAGLPLTGHPLMDMAISAKNMVFKCVPTTTVIDEETGENVLPFVSTMPIIADNPTVWTDADMYKAWQAAIKDKTPTISDDFNNWLTEYKKSKK